MLAQQHHLSFVFHPFWKEKNELQQSNVGTNNVPFSTGMVAGPAAPYDDDAIIRCGPHLMEVAGLTSWKLHVLSPFGTIVGILQI